MQFLDNEPVWFRLCAFMAHGLARMPNEKGLGRLDGLLDEGCVDHSRCVGDGLDTNRRL